MARIVFTKTKDELARGLLLGGGVGMLLAVAVWTPGRPDIITMAMALFIPLAFFSVIGLLMKSYRSVCSDCNAELSRFLDSTSGSRIHHCPDCGAKFADTD